MVGALGWNGVVQVLALAGGLTAVVTLGLNRRDSAASQAAKVFVFVKLHNPDPNHGPYGLEVEIHNDSDQPIFDLGLVGWEWGTRRRQWRLARSTEGWMTGEYVAGRHYPTITPATVIRDDTLPPIAWPTGGRSTAESFNPPVMLRFRDVNGRRWVRWPDGKLTRRRPSRA